MLVADEIRSTTRKALDYSINRKILFLRLILSRSWVEYSYFNNKTLELLCNNINSYITIDVDEYNNFAEEIDYTRDMILREIPTMVKLEPPQHAMAEDALIAAWHFCNAILDLEEIDNCLKIIVRKYFTICDEYIQYFLCAKSDSIFIDDNKIINSEIFLHELKKCHEYMETSDFLAASKMISANLSGPPMSIRWQI